MDVPTSDKNIACLLVLSDALQRDPSFPGNSVNDGRIHVSDCHVEGPIEETTDIITDVLFNWN